MRRDDRMTEMVEDFLKRAAAEVTRPFSFSDSSRRMKARDIGKERPAYAQPSPPTSVTRPDTVGSQKAIPPPQV